MAGAIIWCVTIFGCALLFYCIGVYANRIEKPMWFWSGSEVDPASITDIPAYNRENGKMWKRYSLWYWAAGLAWMWSPAVAVAVLFLGGGLGSALLIRTYLKIEKKYKITGL